MHGLLHDIGVAILAATGAGLLAHWLRQPIILGYLVAGALVGPKIGYGWVHDDQSIDIISEIGLILLLFIIGLELNLKALLASGRQLLLAGFGQFPLCVAMGLVLFGALGYGLTGQNADGLYLALICGLSSTAVVVKLLYDKGELDTLPGRTTLAVLVVQDIYAIFVLAFQPNFANPTAAPVLRAAAAAVALLAGGMLISRFVLKPVLASVAKAPEMVVAVSIGWCAAVAAVADAMHLSKEMGALIAGLSISAFPYSVHVTAKTLPLRDFFLTLFFVSLGMKLDAPRADMAGMVLLLVAFTAASRFLTIYPLLMISGAGRRTAFISSLNLAQISEFSLVIAGLGVAYQHVGQRTVALAIYAMAITSVISSYAIRYNHSLYLLWDRLLTALGRPASDRIPSAGGGEHKPVVILGFHRIAGALIDKLSDRPELLGKIHVVDFNPETLERLAGLGISSTFGDISSRDTLEHAHLHGAQVILCTVPDMLLKGTDNQTLVKLCRSLAPGARIIATAHDSHHEQLLRKQGADEVLDPHRLAADRLVALLTGSSASRQKSTAIPSLAEA